MKRRRLPRLLWCAGAGLLLVVLCWWWASAPGALELDEGGRPVAVDLFSAPLGEGVEPLVVEFVEFAALPDVGGQASGALQLVDVPGAGRIFVATADTMLYSVPYDGGEARLYHSVGAQAWKARPKGSSHAAPASESRVGEGWMRIRGVAFHPRFADEGAPGHGKFYTLLDDWDTEPPADFDPGFGSPDTLDTVLLEWTARDPRAATYDGSSPRELMRIEMPYAHHTGAQIAFRPGAGADDADFGQLYIGLGDGGRNGDPLGLAQDLSKVHGKMLRIDPLGSNSTNGRYGVPADNPFVGDGRDDTLGEIHAYGMRNPNTFGWDALNGNLFVAEIGDNAVDEISLVRPGANLGWDAWEGSFRVVHRRAVARRIRRLVAWGRAVATGSGFRFSDFHEVGSTGLRGDPGVSYPVVEYDHVDPLLDPGRSAVTGVVVCRGCTVPQLDSKALFGDLVVGELFYFSADRLPQGGQGGIGRVLLADGDAQKTLLQLVQEKTAARGGSPTRRVDMRLGAGANGDVFLLNRYDGVIRRLSGQRQP